MKKIYKYTLPVRDLAEAAMPKGAKILCVQNQEDRITLWAECEVPEKVSRFLPEYEKRYFEIIGTGNPYKEIERTYIGTVQVGPYVWHVFEVLK